MAVSSPASGTNIEVQLWRQRRQVSPDRTVVWTEPPNNPNPKPRKVPVLYYLSRNGQLEHPHFMEVPLSSPHGLFLRDVISRLNLLRGEGFASMYSWSCKRNYKNGFVWQDLSETDIIHPTQGLEYVLKGSELPDQAFLDVASPSPGQLPPPERRRRNQSCSSIDFEYSSQKMEPPGRSAAADASTQTMENRRRGRGGPQSEGNSSGKRDEVEIEIEISPSPSGSSPETLETLMKADGRAARPPAAAAEAAEKVPMSASGPHAHVQRCKTSVLMQLISCGSMPFRDCGAGQGLGLMGPSKTRAPRVVGPAEGGSSDQTKKEEFPALSMSTSYSADGSPHLELQEKEIESVKAKCIPRKSKP